LLFDPCNLDEIKKAVLEILSSPTSGKEMALEARSHANNVFHPEAVATRHVEIYQELLLNLQ